MTRVAVVYRVFDAADRLIYIGATSNLKDRMSGHRSLKWWSPLVARYEVEEHPDMAAAFAAEARAIAAERPAFNRTHSGSYFRPLAITAEDIETCRPWAVGREGHVPPVLRSLLCTA